MLIDGKSIAKNIKDQVRVVVKQSKRQPNVVAILLGENPSAESYLRMLERTCESVGFGYEILRLEENTSEDALLHVIEDKNNDTFVDGILVQMPLPQHISEEKVINAIKPIKDLDGFHPMNAGKLFKGEKAIKPCTPLAVMTILDAMGVSLDGKKVVVVGRSNIVGKPLAVMLMHKNATVTVCHSHTVNLKEHTLAADIIITAVGIPHFLKADMVTEDAVVIDVGMNELDGKLVGDVDFDALVEKVNMITPVPGGVGPVTNAVLLLNVLQHFNPE